MAFKHILEFRYIRLMFLRFSVGVPCSVSISIPSSRILLVKNRERFKLYSFHLRCVFLDIFRVHYIIKFIIRCVLLNRIRSMPRIIINQLRFLFTNRRLLALMINGSAGAHSLLGIALILCLLEEDNLW